ncbi:unnamed protein product [Caenorhabditis bovis]|uniref:Protein SPEC3 n=1 Tax=Caenorhabditis bovis TaxID=2654633 RepID=A0A8S1FF18_9PELO|nr:unnamed protein product [Caenorhabditis bovis]
MDFDEEPQAKVDSERISLSPQTNYGVFRQSIPIMSYSMAALCFFLNLVIPGTGTMLAGVSVTCCADARGGTVAQCMCRNLLAGFLQLILTPIVIGWIWSAIWGVMFVQIARKWFISDLDNRADCLDCCPCSRW